jgi:hypothetical protein
MRRILRTRFFGYIGGECSVCGIRDAGFGMRDMRCEILDAGYSILVIKKKLNDNIIT